MKKITLLSGLICLGLCSFAQICSLDSKTPIFRPNEIVFAFRKLDDTIKTITEQEIIPTISMKVLVEKKQQELEFRNQIACYTYHGKILDTMRFVVDAPDFERDTFIFYKKIHHNPYNNICWIYLTPRGKQFNKIVILGDAVDVHINGKKYSYTVSELGRESNDEKGNAQMLLKIPELSVKDYVIYVKNQPMGILFFDGKIAYIGEVPNNKSPGDRLLRELQSLAH